MSEISVIVPVYKVEQFLHRCVESILRQSFYNFELILVDDGSPDSCGEICDAYAAGDNRIHVIHQKNGGLSAARNTGIDYVMKSSDSHWIAFVDSDDWIHPDYLKVLYTTAQKTCCKISACGFFRRENPFRNCRTIPSSVSAPMIITAARFTAVLRLWPGTSFITVPCSRNCAIPWENSMRMSLPPTRQSTRLERWALRLPNYMPITRIPRESCVLSGITGECTCWRLLSSRLLLPASMEMNVFCERP